ncbi:hypothetical protein EHP00_1271 [Ecytonucleospora hepatopenaei]|uniref:Thioredoxin domain-containing protein n=1 Tax=Ecytonucleospora hepatopenaei TaxID=646526 RepID=A0A1W0E6C1_9MICR|nr:hypothetical protein EHP00_1271 [Ecytonucleospora hepatopenaei]
MTDKCSKCNEMMDHLKTIKNHVNAHLIVLNTGEFCELLKEVVLRFKIKKVPFLVLTDRNFTPLKEVSGFDIAKIKDLVDTYTSKCL